MALNVNLFVEKTSHQSNDTKYAIRIREIFNLLK